MGCPYQTSDSQCTATEGAKHHCPNMDMDCPYVNELLDKIKELEEQRDRALAFIEVLLTPPSVEEHWAYTQHRQKVMEARKAYEEVCPTKEKKDEE